jgi:phosphoribosylformimino-5-aminoimidazole carboxamide ribotide isomerase
MEVIPAIDLLNGKCVRLVQGDYEQQRVFDDDPVGVAARWTAAGATRLHVVDLDGARHGLRANAEAVKAIVKSAGVPVQLGGGIRTADDAKELSEIGVDRVIFGTAAVTAPEQVAAAVRQIGAEHVIAGVDARDGFVQTSGWTQTSALTATDLIHRMCELGVRRFMYTDTARDGTLSHPNFDSIASILASVSYPIVAAGGVASIDDLLRLARSGVEAAVTGLAIYSGALDLERAIREVSALAASSD